MEVHQAVVCICNLWTACDTVQWKTAGDSAVTLLLQEVTIVQRVGGQPLPPKPIPPKAGMLQMGVFQAGCCLVYRAQGRGLRHHLRGQGIVKPQVL